MSYTVIGGGLAGLSAAVELARNGAKVRLVEQHHELGGRAATTMRDGFALNLGPHALYIGGATQRALTEWGLVLPGGRPALKSGAYMVAGGERFPLVRDALSLATCPYFSVMERIEAARLLAKLTSGSPGQGGGLTIKEWLDREVSSTRIRLFAEGLVRVSTYCDLGEQSAEAAFQQTKLAVQGVRYLDGGWQVMIATLQRYAQDLGISIETGVRVDAVKPDTILAAGPRAAERLTGKTLPKQTPIRLAALDLALDRLPHNAAVFGLGLDEPLYFSVHTQWAKLAPEGGAVVHIGKYMGNQRSDPAADRAQLERFADLLMPGWREHIHFARFLPNMDVTHSFVPVGGRLDVDALGIPGVYLAGDWVGPEGMLADAATESGRRAARALLRAGVAA